MSNYEYYCSKYISESATLLACGRKFIRIDKVDDICWFIFAEKRKCLNISNAFWFGRCPVDAKSYYKSIIKLKKEKYSLIDDTLKVL